MILKNSITNGFQQYKSPMGVLYIKGSLNKNVEELLSLIETGKSLNDLRGNFALVWIPVVGEPILMVDHFASIPLFYTDKYCGQNFYELTSSLENKVENKDVRIQQTILNGNHIGQGTIYKGVHRLMPGHILINNKQVRYLDFRNYEGHSSKDGLVQARESLEKCIFNRLDEKESVLLFSAGRDSTTLAGIMNKIHMKNNCEFLYLYSDKQFLSEKSFMNNLSKELDIDIIKYQVPNLSVEDIESMEAVRDFTFTPKKRSIIDHNFQSRICITGEVGLGTFNQDSLLYYIANKGKKADPYELAKIILIKLFLRTSRNINAYKIDDSLFQRYLEEMLGDKYKEYYEMTLEALVQMWRDNASDDLYNSCWRFLLQNQSSYRLYKYSQDSEIDWFHPFANWDFISNLSKISSSERYGQHFGVKGVFQKLWGDFLPTTAWKKPKLGLSIPNEREFKMELEVN